MRMLLLAALLLLPACPALAAPTVDDEFCHMQGLPDAIRQTTIVIDGNLIVPESDKPLAENQGWRRFVAQFIDTSDPLIKERVDARERVSIAVANADGSGVTLLFTGCLPIYREEEEKDLDSNTSLIASFFGTDWRRASADKGEKFRRGAALALVQGIKDLAQGAEGTEVFRQSGLVASLSKGVGYTLDNGLPRVILLSNLGKYEFPDGDLAAVRAAARADGEAARIDFKLAELHVFGAAGGQGDVMKNYLEAFMLTSGAYLQSLTSGDGSMNSVPPARRVRVYQGTVDFPDAVYPVRLRLVEDQNGDVANSWIEVRSSVRKYVPLFGVLNCASPDLCRYVGDGKFAQIWDDNPDPKADLKSWQPFGGMRNLAFERSGETISGKVSDEVGYIVGREDGLAFTLNLVANGRF